VFQCSKMCVTAIKFAVMLSNVSKCNVLVSCIELFVDLSSNVDVIYVLQCGSM
jgi:hypothetical protein